MNNHSIIEIEEKIIDRHKRRSMKLGLSSDLTLAQWIVALEHFGYQCAYCQEKPYEVLEHFIPLGLGGGTTRTNCVPACRSCNVSKREWHPFHLPLDFFPFSPGIWRVAENAKRVHEYLMSCEGEAI